MAEILSFRRPGEKCANCVHFVPERDHNVLMIDGPPSQYCEHPDRTKGYYLTEGTIEKLHLRRAPDEWCPKYEKVPSWKARHSYNELIPSIDYEMVFIEPGTFMMGTPEYIEDRFTRKETQHAVTLTRSFYLGATVVTQSQWLRVMGSKPWPCDDEMLKEGDDYPVTWVSWKDCQQFIKNLNQSENTNTFRLPTEAEWEYSCRAGSQTEFCFGDNEMLLDDYAWYMKNTWDIGEMYPHQVAQKRPNEWGLYDTHGNVLEWCQDWQGPYPAVHVTNPIGPSSGSMRVARGGAWSIIAPRCRADMRHSRSPERGYSLTGLRLAKTVRV